MIETKIENVSLDKIRPSKTNPRKHFNEQSLAELIESVSAHGIIQPLVVRPDWCMGKSAEEISKVNGQAPEPQFFEIVAGERRYRAAAKAKLETAPLSIRNFSDQEALEIQLIENLQRDDLDPFDEAAGYQELLNFRTSDGKAVHTVDTIHKRVGKKRSRIYQRLKLLKVPSAIRDAVRGGLSVRIGEMVGALATKQMRAAAAAEVLKPTDPRYGVGPLTVLQAEDLIERNFSRSLSGADFDQKDPLLVPVIQDEGTGERIGGGACSDCPRRTGNMEELIGKTKRPDVCTNPQCFARKNDAHFANLQKDAVAQGKKILTDAEGAQVFDQVERDGSLYFDSPYVKLSDQPDRNDVRSDFAGKPPSWKKLIGDVDAKPQIYVARDPRGRIVELVERTLAIEAVNLAAKEKSQRSIFDKSPPPGSASGNSRRSTSPSSSAASSSGGSEEPAWKEQDRKNREIAKENFQVTLASVSAVIAAIDDKGLQKGFWDALIKASITHAGHDGCWLICKRHGLDSKVGKRVEGFASEGVEGAALEYGLTLPDEAMKIGYVVELLVSQRVKFSQQLGGLKRVGSFNAFATLYGVDLAKVEKDVRAGLKKDGTKPQITSANSPGASKSKLAKAAIIDPDQVQLEKAYSAPEIGKGTIRQPVMVEGKLYTVSGINFGSGKKAKPIFDLVEVIPIKDFKGSPRTPDDPSPKKGPAGNYYGVGINFNGGRYCLGFSRQYKISGKPSIAAKTRRSKKAKTGLTPGMRKKLAASMKARWAARRKAATKSKGGKK